MSSNRVKKTDDDDDDGDDELGVNSKGAFRFTYFYDNAV